MSQRSTDADVPITENGFDLCQNPYCGLPEIMHQGTFDSPQHLFRRYIPMMPMVTAPPSRLRQFREWLALKIAPWIHEDCE